MEAKNKIIEPEKVAYWKKRMIDRSISAQKTLLPIFQEILRNSQHVNLDTEVINATITNIRVDFFNLVQAISAAVSPEEAKKLKKQAEKELAAEKKKAEKEAQKETPKS